MEAPGGVREKVNPHPSTQYGKSTSIYTIYLLCRYLLYAGTIVHTSFHIVAVIFPLKVMFFTIFSEVTQTRLKVVQNSLDIRVGNSVQRPIPSTHRMHGFTLPRPFYTRIQ